jgi:SAM-dependent methyltransferase
VSDVFGAGYSKAYNLIYGDKDYAGECDLLERIFQRFAVAPVSRVLDLGCGTGNHAFVLAERGYDVVGVERSEHMLAVAQQKLAAASNLTLRFQPGDIRSVDAGQQFDAVLILFAVLGYQLENRDVAATLKTARRHLKKDGLLLFDVWYGPAVLHEKPSDRAKVIQTEEGRIMRVASAQLDVASHTCDVKYHLWRLIDDRIASETQETHRMRYFFPKELDLFLESSGFTTARLGVFPDIDKDPTETTWNVMTVARAI